MCQCVTSSYYYTICIPICQCAVCSYEVLDSVHQHMPMSNMQIYVTLICPSVCQYVICSYKLLDSLHERVEICNIQLYTTLQSELAYVSALYTVISFFTMWYAVIVCINVCQRVECSCTFQSASVCVKAWERGTEYFLEIAWESQWDYLWFRRLHYLRHCVNVYIELQIALW